MIGRCEEQKEIVFSLSEEIYLEEIEMRNLEEFSSSVKNFKVYASEKFPAEKWTFVGEFESEEDSKYWQFFGLDPAWARYVKLVWLDSHSEEDLCCMTQLRVCGRTMMQGLKQHL